MTKLEMAARLDALSVNASLLAHSGREVLRIAAEIPLKVNHRSLLSQLWAEHDALWAEYDALAELCRKQADELRESDA